MSTNKKPLSATITIFGAKGDLTKRKLIPALYNLFAEDHLPPSFSIYCIDFVAVEETAYRNDLLPMASMSSAGTARPIRTNGRFSHHA